MGALTTIAVAAIVLRGVWVSSRRAATATRIDPRTYHTDPAIRVGRSPADIAVGLGAVWVANADGGSVSRIDPQRDRADASIPVGARQALAVTVADGGVQVVRATGLSHNLTCRSRSIPETARNGDGLRKGLSPAERTHYLKGLNHMISRSKRAVAGTFAAAVLGVAGVAGVAIASGNTDTCTHGVAVNSSGHRQVVYESSRTSAGQHVHKYKHDVNNWPDHHPERNCNH